jgi:hypothetical protein
MADVRLSGKDLARLEKLQGDIGKAVKGLDVVALERMSREVAGRVNSAVKGLLQNLDTVASRLGVDSKDGKVTLRRSLEAVEGASAAATEAAPLLATLPMDPRLRLGILAATALAGGVAGANREFQRRRMEAAAAAEEEALLEALRDRARDRDEIDRYNAARRRARSFR